MRSATYGIVHWEARTSIDVFCGGEDHFVSCGNVRYLDEMRGSRYQNVMNDVHTKS